ncbi:MAG: DUF1588 domain-containing protein [Novosphingobium sp.]
MSSHTRDFKFLARRLGLATAAVGALLGGALALAPAGAGSSAVAAPGDAAALLPEPGLRLISQSQYVNTVHRIFGEDIAVRIRFAPVKRVDGLLAVGASTAVLTPGALDPLDATARSIAAQVTDEAHRRFLVPCTPADARAADEACARAFIARTGRLLFRRPLTSAELARYTGMATRAAGAGGFYPGLANALSGMLVSPQFLYIREIAEPGAAADAWRLDAYSKASRLSFLLWNSGPDDELLTAAERGEFNTAEGLRRQFDRMVASPRYQDGVREFFTDFLVFEAFDTLAKDPTIYPAFSLKAVAESREQALRTVVDHLVARKGDYRELFTTRNTFMSSELGVIYQVPVNTGALGWVPYRFPAGDPRGGLLTQTGFLAQYAHAGRSSPTRRGRAIREVLLCQHVPDPPPNVDFSNFEDPKSGLHTARERLTAHNENPVCAGCHKVTDPIGLSLENFDGAGQFRTMEGTARIDVSGSLDGVAFSDPAGLGKALAGNESLKSCIVNRLYAYSVGRKLLAPEEARLEQYQAALDKRGYRFDDMLRMIVLDPSFFAIRPVRPDLLQTAALTSAPVHGDRHAH